MSDFERFATKIDGDFRRDINQDFSGGGEGPKVFELEAGPNEHLTIEDLLIAYVDDGPPALNFTGFASSMVPLPNGLKHEAIIAKINGGARFEWAPLVQRTVKWVDIGVLRLTAGDGAYTVSRHYRAVLGIHPFVLEPGDRIEITAQDDFAGTYPNEGFSYCFLGSRKLVGS